MAMSSASAREGVLRPTDRRIAAPDEPGGKTRAVEELASTCVGNHNGGIDVPTA